MNLKKNNPYAKRIWFITDTHLGVRNNSNDWLEQTKDYFDNWFFPLVKSKYRKGDILLHLGDYFDSRQSINLKVLDLGVYLAESFSKIFEDGTYIIIGNHDIWGKSSNEVNSLKVIKWIPNIHVYEEAESVKFGNRDFFLMPWQKDHEAEKITLEECNPHDVLCCHTDIQGLRFNKYTVVETGTKKESFFKFEKVYSGHIHYSQTIGNIRMLGCPYELTRSDMDNPKSVVLLDLETMEEETFQNDYSPKFKRFYFNEILESTPEDLDPLFRNNFVDIMIDPIMAIKAPLSILTDTITSQRFLKFHPYDPTGVKNFTEQILDTDGKQFNVLDFISEYIENMDYDDETKSKLKNSLFKVHNLVISQEQDQKIS